MTQRLKGPPTLTPRTPEQIDAIKADYLAKKLTLRQIYAKHSVTDTELRALVNLQKWDARGKGAQRVGVVARLYKPSPPRPRRNQFDGAAIAKETREREAADDSKRYGKHLDDVNFLRSRGVAIHVEPNGLLRVGNVLKQAADVKQIADRERRLMQPVAL